MKLAITIPTYNEATNIKKLLPAIKNSLPKKSGWNCTVFVIDDNSPDKTAGLAKKIGAELKDRHFKVEVLSRKEKEGLGKAYIYAFKKILPKGYDFILQMDADLSHDPKYLPQFLRATKDADFVVGSRYVAGGGTPDWQWYRILLSHGGNLYARFFLGSKITDYTTGYNLYSTELLRKININNLRSDGYEFLIELKSNALRLCKKADQVPIIFTDRKHGKSKIPRSYIIKTLLLVPTIRFRHRS